MLPGAKFCKLFLIALFVFPWAILQIPAEAAKSNKMGLQKHKLNMRVLSKKRNYLIYLPDTPEPASTLPVIIVLHGAFSTAKGIMKVTGFNRLADSEKLIMVYPNGAYGLFGLFQHWNAGHCCGKAQKDNQDDVRFLVALIEDLKIRFGINGRMVFMVGFSNGGMMTYRFCAEHPEMVSAAAILAGSIGGRASAASPYWRIPDPRQPVPLIVLHGRQDNSVPYAGGRDERHRGDREYDSVADSVGFWVKNNRCVPEPQIDYLLERRIEKKTWSDEKNRPLVVLYSIDDWGHYWPGASRKRDHSLPGFDAAKVIWDYFKQVPDLK